VFGICCPDPNSKPTRRQPVPLLDDDNELGRDDDDFPVEEQVNLNCGKRFVQGRIVNGKVTQRHELPFMAALVNKDFHFCGGSLIDSKHVLTAAHCVHQ
jgi:hypothetical protein